MPETNALRLPAAQDEGWAEATGTLHAMPFGRRPGFEEALAAPGRRRRLYGAVQAGALACLLLAVGGIVLAERTYGEWIEQGIEDSDVQAAVVKQLREQQSPLNNDKLYHFMVGRNAFVEALGADDLAEGVTLSDAQKSKALLDATATLATAIDEAGRKDSLKRTSEEEDLLAYAGHRDEEVAVPGPDEKANAAIYDHFVQGGAFAANDRAKPLIGWVGGILLLMARRCGSSASSPGPRRAASCCCGPSRAAASRSR